MHERGRGWGVQLLLYLIICIFICTCEEEEDEEEEEEEPLLIYTAQGNPFRCKRLPVINGSPELNNVQNLHYTYKHYTNTDNNINRKLSTNKGFKSYVNTRYH